MWFSHSLKDHLVGSIILGKREFRSEIILHQRRRLHNLENGRIHLLLIRLARVADDGGLGGIIGKEFLFSLGIGGGNTGEVCIINIGNVHGGHVQLGGCANHVGLVDPAQWHAIDFVGSGDQEETALQRL